MTARETIQVDESAHESTQSMSGLLAQALDVPSLDHVTHNDAHDPLLLGESIAANSLDASDETPVARSFATSPPLRTNQLHQFSFLNSNSAMPETPKSQTEIEHVFLPQHSDFTIPTSNARLREMGFAPPLEITPSPKPGDRRSVFGKSVGCRYTFTPKLATPPQSPSSRLQTIHQFNNPMAVSPLTPAHPIIRRSKDLPKPKKLMSRERELSTDLNQPRIHETIHAQSFLLGVAFMAIWSPNNVMAPNLTQMADFFGMTEAERDLYLGSYCALAVGVFSLPISALIGFMADFYSRKNLFLACVVGGSLASAWTGCSTNFTSLFLARLTSGGCMSASVPVAFSLLGDLFATEERNAASSGLTAMMGLGIILGQVYAGTVGPIVGWSHPFFVSSLLSLSTAVLVLLWVQEPDRGAKEKVLQDMLQAGNKYDRQLTFEGFIHAMRHNRSNMILLWQGFFTSLPWGIVFVFLNDFLSQEKGFSVPDATFMVMLFGVGCAIGGICGGYIGQVCVTYNRTYLPLFMSATTFLGAVPFLLLLNSTFTNHHGYKAMGYSILGGCVASLPSVNNRPCIINVNPPETRGAALTASNLLITLGRGIGPSCITLMGSILHLSRQKSFNITLTVFWTISAVQLLFLAKTLPQDQDAMEEELARWAAQQNGNKDDEGGGIETVLLSPESHGHAMLDDGESLVSIEEYMTSFDGLAARRSIQFMRQGIKELKEEITYFGGACGNTREESDEDGSTTGLEDILSSEELEKRRQVWRRQQQRYSQNELVNEETPLVV